MKEIYIGTSGYNYAHWRDGVFYPEGLAQNKWLEYYSKKFNSVELNVTFYRLPSAKAFEGWRRKTPEDFRFVIKGNRYITHTKRLKDVSEPLKNFKENLTPLKEKTTCILWQLPPSFKANEKILEGFISQLEKLKMKRPFRHVFEFRNETWFDEKIYKILKKANISLCIADLPDTPHEEILTSDFIYFRFHGRTERYSSNYSSKSLKSASSKAKKWLASRKALYAFFNNDAYGYAPKNAMRFKEEFTSP